mgnify:CR=1 FL=1
MTRGHGETVRLSSRDWLGITSLTLTVLFVLGSQFIRHDRLLTEVLVKQETLSARVAQVEDTLSNMRFPNEPPR